MQNNDISSTVRMGNSNGGMKSNIKNRSLNNIVEVMNQYQMGEITCLIEPELKRTIKFEGGSASYCARLCVYVNQLSTLQNAEPNELVDRNAHVRSETEASLEGQRQNRTNYIPKN